MAKETSSRERRCVASGESMPEAKLVRFALGPDDLIVPDVAAKLPGRGVWVSAARAAVEQAAKKGGFARSLKQSVQAPPDLADQTERLLTRRCLDLLGLMKRASAIALGFDQSDAAIRAKPPGAVIEASDGAADGREKLLRLALGLWGVRPHVSGAFTMAEMGVALGRDHVVHAVVLEERMAQRWAAETGRLSGFRAIVPASWPDPWRDRASARLDGGGKGDVAAGEPASASGEQALPASGSDALEE